MSNRKGFTLIELLIVVVIIGILAAIAIPKFANTKEKAVVAGMKSDLRNLVTAQEGFFSDNQTYATGKAATQSNAPASPACGGSVAFGPTQGNVLVFVGHDCHYSSSSELEFKEKLPWMLATCSRWVR